MNIIQKIQDWHFQRRRRRALAGIRKTMALFGYDASQVCDDDLWAESLKLMEFLKERLTQVGHSAEAAGHSLERMGLASESFDLALYK